MTRAIAGAEQDAALIGEIAARVKDVVVEGLPSVRWVKSDAVEWTRPRATYAVAARQFSGDSAYDGTTCAIRNPATTASAPTPSPRRDPGLDYREACDNAYRRHAHQQVARQKDGLRGVGLGESEQDRNGDPARQQA